MPEQQLLFAWGGAAAAREPDDAGERRRALNPARSFIVQAPAGSGKTELLIQRYLTLLARVAAPEQIVAITFTVKAAAEMRERVLEALSSAGEPEPEAAHERLTWELARAVAEQDERLGWGLSRSPSRMRIQTIDALSMSIVRQMPWVARMGAMPEVTEDARLMYEGAAEATIRLLEEDTACGRAVETLLRHVDFDAGVARGLIAEMLAIRDHWLPVMGVQADAGKLRAVLEGRLSSLVCAGLERITHSLSGGELRELGELARIAAGNIEDQGRLPRCRTLQGVPGANAADLTVWREIATLLLTDKGEWRSSPDKRIGFPAKSLEKDRFERLRSPLERRVEFREALEALSRLPDPAYSDWQWQTLDAVFTLLPRAVAELRLIFAERGVADFTEVSQAALAALGSPQSPTDLALALGHRIEHLLVDEFQDTSRTQETLLRALTAGWESGDGRTLFVVGDPMQSIYRFRQAEVGIFLALRERGLASLALEPVTLSANFRSAAQVVEWNNACFEAAFPRQGDVAAGAVEFKASVAFRGEAAGAGVFVHPILDRDDEQETARTVALIEAGVGERVAVLVRARTHLLDTAARLRQRGIPFRAIEIDSLGERAVVQDLMALTRGLLNLADRPAWFALLRAPWCGLTLADLEALAGDGKALVWEALAGPARGLSEDGAARLARVKAVMEAALARRGRIPLRRLIEGVWVALDGPSCLANDADLTDAGSFLELLEREERGGDLADLDVFARRVTDLFSAPDPAADGAVELMTIHKAKGLEFDHVIIPGLGRGTKQDDPRLFLWSERDGGEVLLAPIAPRRGERDYTYEMLAAEDRAKARHETVRLLYVACTRARKRLHLIGHVRSKEGGIGKPDSGSFLEVMWPAVSAAFGELKREQVPAPEPPEVPPLRRLARVNALVAGAAAPVATSADGGADGEVRGAGNAVGTVVHRFLERIAREGPELWSEARVKAARPQIEFALRGEEAGEAALAVAAAAVERALTGTLGSERGRWVLKRRAEAENEYSFAAVVGGAVRHLQVDRTFVDEGTRWIVDYKTGSMDEEATHWPQLERYARALKEFDARPIRLGLYFVLSQQWSERAFD